MPFLTNTASPTLRLEPIAHDLGRNGKHCCPLRKRADGVWLTVGGSIVAWGGRQGFGKPWPAYNDGYLFEVSTGLWSGPVSPSPLAQRAFSAVVSTGEEMIIWGGSESTMVYQDGARFIPTKNRWTMLPAASG